jgi:hypothetical protein
MHKSHLQYASTGGLWVQLRSALKTLAMASIDKDSRLKGIYFHNQKYRRNMPAYLLKTCVVLTCFWRKVNELN